MQYVVSLSGGVASAVTAERAIARYGRAAVKLWIADTSWEDEDLWRFTRECMQRWGGRLYVYCDGRTPLQVAEDKKIIPNHGHAPCSFELKVKPFREFLWRQPKPITVLLGLDWKELHRIEKQRHYHMHASKPRAPQGYARLIHGVYEDYPLLWKPLEFRPYQNVVRAWGIAPPRLYEAGFPHNNCGGRCVKQGMREWQRLKIAYPDRFAEVRDWENRQREKGGARANFAILSDRTGGERKPIPLIALEQRDMPTDNEPSTDDMFACMCEY